MNDQNEFRNFSEFYPYKYPLNSLMGDWVMFRDMLIGRIRF